MSLISTGSISLDSTRKISGKLQVRLTTAIDKIEISKMQLKLLHVFTIFSSKAAKSFETISTKYTHVYKNTI
jgi:hypothetical protein